MTTRTMTRDEQVSTARKYQTALVKLMYKLEEDLTGGVFTDGKIREAMLTLKLCTFDAVHDAAMHTLTTTEEEASVHALEDAAAAYGHEAQTRVKMWILKKTGSVQA